MGGDQDNAAGGDVRDTESSLRHSTEMGLAGLATLPGDGSQYRIVSGEHIKNSTPANRNPMPAVIPSNGSFINYGEVQVHSLYSRRYLSISASSSLQMHIYKYII